LNRNIFREHSVWGTPFLDERSDIRESSNLIIHAHNMRNFRMFGALEQYRNRVFLENNRIVELITFDGIFNFEIIEVVTMDVSNPNIHNYYNPNRQSADGNRILTLSTCEYSTPNGRLMVIAELEGS